MSQHKVALHGLETRAAERFRNLFLINFRGKYSITTQDDQDVDIVDIDLYAGDTAALLDSLAASRTLILSDNAKFPTGFCGLIKPAKINELAELLDQAVAGKLHSAQKISSRSATSYQSNTQAISEQIGESAAMDGYKTLRLLNSSEQYRAADFFLDMFLDAYREAANHDAVELRNWNNERFILTRKYNVLYCDISKNQFRNIAAIAVPQGLRQKLSIAPLTALPPAGELETMYQQPLERAVWELAYGTSRGRLPQHLDSCQCYSLRKWPNFTRLPRMKNGMRIAAIWSGNALSAADIASQLQIDLGEVHAFLVACDALSLLEQAANTSATPVRTARSNSIFNSLLSHLNAAFGGKKQLRAG